MILSKVFHYSLKGCPGLLAGTVLTGGIIAPVIQFSALSVTPAAMAALLLNFEIIATAAFAWGIFHERVTKNLLLAIVLVLLGSLVLSFDTGSVWGFSIGAAGILFSCIFWGLDNNLMGRVPVDNPSTIVIIKGLIGGGVLFLAIPFFHVSLPDPGVILITLLTGFFTFGFGLVLLIGSLRSLGAAKTAAYFATAPFIGAFSSLVLFRQAPGLQIFISVPLFTAGIIVLLAQQKAGFSPYTQDGPATQRLIRFLKRWNIDFPLLYQKLIVRIVTIY